MFEGVPVGNPMSSSRVIKLLGRDKGEICSAQKMLKDPERKRELMFPTSAKGGLLLHTGIDAQMRQNRARH